MGVIVSTVIVTESLNRQDPRSVVAMYVVVWAGAAEVVVHAAQDRPLVGDQFTWKSGSAFSVADAPSQMDVSLLTASNEDV